MPYAIIDRFEGDMAVLEMPDGAMRTLPRASLPQGARAGDALRLDEAGNPIALDPEETRRRQAEVRALMDKLFRRG